MPINGSLRLFTDDEIERAPISNGVYALYDTGETIYIGKAEGLYGVKGRLQAHKAGYEGVCTKHATAFEYELCFSPTNRERELLVEYEQLYRKLPRCNDVIP